MHSQKSEKERGGPLFTNAHVHVHPCVCLCVCARTRDSGGDEEVALDLSADLGDLTACKCTSVACLLHLQLTIVLCSTPVIVDTDGKFCSGDTKPIEESSNVH